MAGIIYEVIVDISTSEVDKIFDYSAAFPVPVGARVLVPFGRYSTEGFVVGTKEKSTRETKDIIEILDDFAAITPEMIQLAEEMRRSGLRYIDCLRLFVPSKLRGGRVKPLIKYVLHLSGELPFEEMLTSLRAGADKQRGLLFRLRESAGYETELNAEFGRSAVKSLLEKGYLKREEVTLGRTPVALKAEKKNIVLTPDQQRAVDTVSANEGTYLVHGVTGSGKTEVYLNVIEKEIAKGRTAIMLVPEISLTPQMLGVFRLRFGDKVSLLHSGLSDGERFDEWLRLLKGEAVVALGARSAVFAPLDNVGVIIVDEEHDGSYVSESNPRYFTAEIAEFRRKYHHAKLILGSATPSMETYLKAKNGEYTLVPLKHRANGKEMPQVETVDMRLELRAGNMNLFSRELLRAMDETLENGCQMMVFINRRGYASFLRCPSCGYIPKCTDCEVTLTYHKEDDTLKCHYCGKQFHAVHSCPVCGYAHMKDGKMGTEKVAEEITRIFPKARVLRMDNDTTSTKDAYLKILTDFSEGRANVLVGTQMIAKGHDFKNVTLVAILDADLALYFPDYRSNERTFQLITQMAGRAGREKKAGRVVLQTYNPKHFVFRFAADYDYEGFFEKEINSREVTKFPPFTKIVRIMVQGKEEDRALSAARELYTRCKQLQTERRDGIIRVQVMRAPIKRIRNYFRFQLVIWLKREKEEESLDAIYSIVTGFEDKKVSVFAEINPQQML